MLMYKVTNLEAFNKFEEIMNGLLSTGDEISVKLEAEEVDDFAIKLHDLHDSVGMKVEDTPVEEEQPSSVPEVTMSGNLQFTKVEEEIFVDLVKANECLWNSSCSDFKNDKKRTEVWEQIALHMNKPVADLKKQWRNLRGIYIKETWKPTGLEPTAEGDENVFGRTNDELRANRLSFLSSSPTERKRRSSSCSATIAASDVQSLSTSSEFRSTEFEVDDINLTMEEDELLKTKRTRRESVVQRQSQVKSQFKEGGAYLILKLFHYYGLLVAKLPRDLQRLANIKTMGLINELDEIASNRTN